MTQTLSPQQIQSLAARLNVDRPILAWRVTGGRVELHLLGGGVAGGELGELLPETAAPDPPNYAFMKVADLRDLAAARGMRDIGKMRKRDLVKALRQLDKEAADNGLPR